MTNSSQGFKDDASGTLASDTQDDYNYDANGNMTSDRNKHITQIRYNHLNLPTNIQFDTGNNIQYTYDAAGIKQEKKVDVGSYQVITKYRNGYQGECNSTNDESDMSNYISNLINSRDIIKVKNAKRDPNKRLVHGYGNINIKKGTKGMSTTFVLKKLK